MYSRRQVLYLLIYLLDRRLHAYGVPNPRLQALLIDEDTAATNFMIRDERMRQLVRADPISPFIQRVRALADSGVSTVLVVGGCGDYFEVADHVIMMQDFLPQDATARARAICARMAAARGTGPNPDDAQAGDAALGRRPPAGSSASAPTTHVVVAVADRIVAPLALLPDGKVNGRRKDCLSFGDRDIDLGGVEQIVEVSQVRAIGDIMLKLGQLCEVRQPRPSRWAIAYVFSVK